MYRQESNTRNVCNSIEIFYTLFQDKMTFNLMFEELVNNIGGCGRYQWIISFLIHLAKTSVCWSMIHMTFNGQQPGYECESWANTTGIRYEGTCDPENYTCDARVYSDDMNTIVNEVCHSLCHISL